MLLNNATLQRKLMMMKNAFCLILLAVLFSGCSSDDSVRNQNPNLVDLRFTMNYNLTLPQYNQLNFAGNSVQDFSVGISGINIFYLGNNQYLVFELTDPNHPVSECSRLLVDGINAACQCDDGNVYSLTNGQQIEGDGGQFSLKPYRAVLNGDILSVSN